MWRAGFQALWSHWRKHPLQLATLVLGLALATALWSGVQAINAEARASYDEAAQALGETEFTQLLPTDGDTIPEQIFVDLRRAGWQVSPILEDRLEVGERSVRLIGFDPLTAPRGFAPDGDAAAPDLATFFAPPFQIIANPKDATAVSDATGAHVLSAEQLALGIVLTDINAAREWLQRPAAISRLILDPAGRPGLRPIEEIAPNLARRSPNQGSDVARLTDSFHLNLTAFGLLSFAVGLFIVHGTIGLAFEQRRGLFRTLRALGLPLRVLLRLVAIELAAIALIAGTVGMMLGYLIAAALLPDVAATLRGLYGADVDGTLSLRPAWWLAGLGIALAGTALASANAFWRVARLPLLVPALPRAWARLSEQRLIGLFAAAMSLAVVALIAVQVPGLVAGFTFLGALLIACALMLPIVLFGALRLGQALAKGPVTQWFWADTRQQLPGLSLALMALLLALATNIGVGTMVSSFRLTFVGYLDQRLASELYVTARDAQQSKELQTFLEGRADAVLPIWNIDGRVSDLPVEIFGVVDHATYRDNWPLLTALDAPWDRVMRSEGAMINEQMSRRLGLSPGDMVDLPGGWAMPVAGVYSDYGNAIGQVVVAMPTLQERFPDLDTRRFGLRTQDADLLASALVEEFGLERDQMINQAEIKAFSLQVFERTFLVSGALNILTLAVAGFAILTSLLTLSALRQPQLAPVWSLGLTRRHLAWLEVLRAVILAVLTAMAAIPVGLLLAWALLAVINVEAFGWRLPMFLFPWDWVRLGLWALFAAVVAALWPARRLARTPPADLLKVFAHER